jgi:hypothetical protein
MIDKQLSNRYTTVRTMNIFNSNTVRKYVQKIGYTYEHYHLKSFLLVRHW